MNEVIRVDEAFNAIVAEFDMTAAEAVGMGADTSAAGLDAAPADPTTFETLARTPDAIRDNMTRLIITNDTTDYTMPEGEKD